MKRTKVMVDFIKHSPINKAGFCHNVIDCMTGNPLYPTPDVTMADAKKAADNLDKAILAALDGSHIAMSALHDAVADVDTLFRILAAYVDRIAEGDETSILSSGFHSSKQPVLSNKETLTAIDGSHSGSVKLIAKAVDRAAAYIWRIAYDKIPDNDSGWTQIGVTTCANFEISNLPIATKCFFQVAPVTPDGTLDFCAPVMKVIQ